MVAYLFYIKSFVYATSLRIAFQKMVSLFEVAGKRYLFIFQSHHKPLLVSWGQFSPLLFLAQSLSDLKHRSESFHFLFLDSSPFSSPESLTEMLGLPPSQDQIQYWDSDI